MNLDRARCFRHHPRILDVPFPLHRTATTPAPPNVVLDLDLVALLRRGPRH